MKRKEYKKLISGETLKLYIIKAIFGIPNSLI